MPVTLKTFDNPIDAHLLKSKLESEGIAKSFMVSTVNQTVEIKALGQTFEFEAGEKIHTEISRKYNDELINKIIWDTDFKLETKIMDSKAYFADYILTRN